MDTQIWDGEPACQHEWSEEVTKRPNASGGKTGWNESKGKDNASEFVDYNKRETKSEFCKKCGAWRGCLGLEPTAELYVKHMCDIFDGVRHTLRDDGVVYLNIGDTYISGGGSSRHMGYGDPKNPKVGEVDFSEPKTMPQSFPEKCLGMVPYRVALGMIARDTMDIYELNRDYILCNNLTITKYIAEEEGQDAIQGSGKSEGIQHPVSKEMENGSSTTIPQTNERVGEKEPQTNSCLQQKALLGEQGERDNAMHDGERQETSQIENGGSNKVWWKSSEVCLLWRDNLPISDNRSHKGEREQTSQRNKKIWLDLRMAKENELSKRFQDFVHELQLGKREVWILPPSGRKNLCLRKRDIPVELLPLFTLAKEDRWILRNVIMWHKPNAMPTSVSDRYTVDFEPIFFFSKSPDYYFEQQFEKVSTKDIPPRIKRTTWSVSTKPLKEEHFAPYPEELVEDPIKAGCPRYICNKCGTPRTKIIERVGPSSYDLTKNDDKSQWKSEQGQKQNMRGPREAYERPIRELGYSDCKCGEGFHPGVVLDPFMGSGTTAIAARKLGRDYIGIDLNQKYIDMANKRIKTVMI